MRVCCDGCRATGDSHTPQDNQLPVPGTWHHECDVGGTWRKVHTDAEISASVASALGARFQKSEPRVDMPKVPKFTKRPDGDIWMVEMECHCGGSVRRVSVGTASPEERQCEHNFYLDAWDDKTHCINCGLEIDGQNLRQLRIKSMHEQAKEHERVIGECMAFKQENTELLAENARLRRRLDK